MIPESILTKVENRQKTIVTDINLSPFGYLTMGLNTKGVQRWQEKEFSRKQGSEYRKAHPKDRKTEAEEIKEIMQKVENRQKYINTNMDLSSFGYKKNYTKHNIQGWISEEEQQKLTAAHYLLHGKEICKRAREERAKNKIPDEERVLTLITKRQKFITTNIDLSFYGYVKHGKHNVIQVWAVKEIKQEHAKYYLCNKVEIGKKEKKYAILHREDTNANSRKYRKTINGRNTQRNHRNERRNLKNEVLFPVNVGEIFHHITDTSGGGVPTNIHQQLSGHSRKKHRTLVLQWLKENDKRKYNLALCALASVRPILPL